ncbi:L,D-transpeptidase family protein [Streptomyces sp. NPDC090022]|uniref:L,D-transpeptidase family protein n=1 Tax=Streptomyces sp. NPDC090022 TaxID=3365920 RepID=UPI0038136961
MSKHARSTPARFRFRTPRCLALTAGIGLLTFTAGWIYAAQEPAGTPSVQAARDDRPPAQPAAPHAGRGEHRDPARGLAGVSEHTRARIPADSRQLVLVAGTDRTSSESVATLYTRPGPDADWRPVGSWPARNGARGWTDAARRSYGDLTSPEGVFSLTDAGGLLPEPPGTRLPYDRDDLFVPSGRGVNGESLRGSFDYVVAIDFNRRPGTSPLDPAKPEGAERGGNIWLHVDHDGPSQGCVGIPREAMKTVLQTLDPAAKPVIVMGPKGF